MMRVITIVLVCTLAGCNAIERHETRSAAKQARADYHKAIEPHHTAYRLSVINATPEQKAAALAEFERHQARHWDEYTRRMTAIHAEQKE